jgi:hypothetical protein
MKLHASLGNQKLWISHVRLILASASESCETGSEINSVVPVGYYPFSSKPRNRALSFKYLDVFGRATVDLLLGNFPSDHLVDNE